MKKVVKKLFEREEKGIVEPHYEGINDLPIWNWFQIQETNDLGYLLKVRRKITAKEEEYLNTIIDKISDEYIDIYGISDEYRIQMQLRAEIMRMKLEFMIDGDRALFTFIQVKEAELKALSNKTNSANSNSLTVYVRKYYGGNVDFKVMTVREFYDTLLQIQKESKK